MTPHPDDPTTASDLTLVESARAGDRLSFGVLYLRHHAAAWRLACVVSRFSPDAELAVIEGFTRVFSALPRKSEESASDDVNFRPYLLACVRQSALDRARSAGRASGAPAPLAGLAPDGELVLSSLEHHVARGALAELPERSRTALWLSEVEAMTPAEITALVGGRAEEITELVDRATKDLHAASQAALVGHEVRAECRFTVTNIEAFESATLDPGKGVLVRSHLDLCPTCRMRFAELANGPARLAAAVPAAPLLGGEAQQHWLTSVADVHPADRLLPPNIAAATLSELPMPARRMAAAAATMPRMARTAGRKVWPSVPAMALVLAWVGVMLALPNLMEPDTAPGPGGMALPAVQAYVPGYLTTGPKTPPADTSAAGASELAIQLGTDAAPAAPAPAPTPAPPSETSVKLISTATAPRRSPTSRATRSTAPASRPPTTVPALPAVIPAVTAAALPAVSPIVPAMAPSRADRPSKAVAEWRDRVERKLRAEAAEMRKSRRTDIASLRAKAREVFDGRVARREARRRHTDHAESA